MEKFSWTWVLLIILLFIKRTDGLSPIIIIPGSTGNQIDAKLVNKPSTVAWYCSKNTKSYFKLWLDISSFVPKASNCWADNMRLEWNNSNLTVTNSPGVVTRIPGFGQTWSIETLDVHGFVKYMKPFIDHFVAMGYQRGQNIRAAPYDFRYSPDQMPGNYYDKLKKLIEGTYESNGQIPVTLVSHSYGCTVTMYFLMQTDISWKNKYLKQWFPLAGPFGGSIKLVHLYTSGDFEGLPDFIFDREIQRNGQRTGTANLFLLPSTLIWPTQKVIVSTPHRKYTIVELDDLLRDINFSQGIAMRQHLVSKEDMMRHSPGLPVFCLFGNIANSTVEQVVFGDDFPDKADTLVKGDGDGTVNLRSLEMCQDFIYHQTQPVYVETVAGASHSGILNNEYVWSYILKRL